jgi:hypothetical protein
MTEEKLANRVRPPARPRSINCWRRYRRWCSTCPPDNHPDIDPASLFLQITALHEAELAAV